MINTSLFRKPCTHGKFNSSFVRVVSNILFSILLFTFFANAFAYTEPVTFGSMATELTVGVGVFTKIMHFVCFVMGLIFVIMAVSLFRANRTNPKYVPLDRPILYLVISVVLFAIPFLGAYFVETGALEYQEKREARAKGVEVQDIDAPLDWGNDFNH